MTWDELVTIEPRLERAAVQARRAGERLRFTEADDIEMACGWRRFVCLAVMEFIGPDVAEGLNRDLFSMDALWTAYDYLRRVFTGQIDGGHSEFDDLMQRVIEKLNSGDFEPDDPDLEAYKQHLRAIHGTV